MTYARAVRIDKLLGEAIDALGARPYDHPAIAALVAIAAEISRCETRSPREQRREEREVLRLLEANARARLRPRLRVIRGGLT